MTQSSSEARPEKSRAWLFSLVAIVISTLLAGTYVWISRRLSEVTPEAAKSVKIAAVAYIGSCPILMADANGYFANEGIAAEIYFQANGKDALAEVLKGRADLATAADIPIMYAAANGQPVSVVATMTTMEDHAVVGRTDRGIVAPVSLRGKRIGVTIGTTTQFFLDALLNRNKLSPADVTVVDLPPKALAEALARGEIDAAVLYQPFLNISATSLGNEAIVLSGEAVYDVSFVLAGTRDYVAAHHGTLEKVLRATLRGAQSCKESSDSARTVLAEAMKTDPGTLKSIWSSYQFEIVLRQGLILTLEDEARWAIKNKLTAQTKVPNFLNNMGLEPLRAVAPSAVTVIH
jgi:NitT/TauT family transport system substrate-binding protein